MIIILHSIFLFWLGNHFISFVFSTIIVQMVVRFMLKKGFWFSKIIFPYSMTGCIIASNMAVLFTPNFDYADYIGLYTAEFLLLFFLQHYYFKVIDCFRNSDINNVLFHLFCGGKFKEAYLYALILVCVKFIFMYLQSVFMGSHTVLIYLIFDVFVCGIIALFLFFFLKRSQAINILFYSYIFISIVLLPSIFWITIIYSIVGFLMIL